jgi:acetyl-CoA carboxylase biotin carboxyl carrier protein
MRPEDLSEIAAAMAVAGIRHLELTGPHVRLVLGRGASAEPPAVEVEAETMAPEAETITVVAPGVGTFLRAHPLHDRPLATAGDAVGAGQPIAVLQVGMLLLPVVASAAAVMIDAAVEDGTLVGYGDRLFDLPPQD